MNQKEAIQRIRSADQRGRYVFNLYDLSKMFPEDTLKSRRASIARLVKSGILERACRGIYINTLANSFDAYTIEHIAKALRRGEYNYVSLESALAEYGTISQAPVDRLTVITTGRNGVYVTPYGVIEFTHTKRDAISILDSTITVPNRPLRIAKNEAAIRDLKRVGRNTDLLTD